MYDRGNKNFKCRSVDLPSLTLSNRDMTRINIKDMYVPMGTLSVLHRPFIVRQSDESRAIIGRPVTEKYIYVHANYITM